MAQSHLSTSVERKKGMAAAKKLHRPSRPAGACRCRRAVLLAALGALVLIVALVPLVAVLPSLVSVDLRARDATAVAGPPAAGAGAAETMAGRYRGSGEEVEEEEDASSPSPAEFLGRFPVRGTEEYSRRCGWASASSSSSSLLRRRRYHSPRPGGNCTLLVRQRTESNEGVAHWSSEVVAGFLYALQVPQCRLLVDYDGNGTDFSEVLVPASEERNWTVPWGGDDGEFVCSSANRCSHVKDSPTLSSPARMERMAEELGLRNVLDKDVESSSPPPLLLVPVPEYRRAFSDDKFSNLTRSLPWGFRPRDGMACAFGELFRLSPSLERYVPSLYEEILPAVRDADALVISVYIRTGRTDRMAKGDKGEAEYRKRKKRPAIPVKAPPGMKVELVVGDEGPVESSNPEDDRTELGQYEEGVVACALEAERDYILASTTAAAASSSSSLPSRQYSRVVWTVISDSINVARTVASRYTGPIFNSTAPSSPSSVGAGGASIRRHVLTTGARGIHSRPRRFPSTSDFAESFVDWYLLGEADVMATGYPGYSFGTTAALRTGRMMYTAMGSRFQCVRREWGVSPLKQGGGSAVSSGLLQAAKGTAA